MLLPSKTLPADQALVAVAAQILLQLDRPRSVSATWDRLLEWRSARGMDPTPPFWWFSLALDLLYAIGAVEHRDGELTRLPEGTRRAARPDQ
ncbi:ABC-three component system middle component 6 [Actinomadura kijaniata]|uniref:ABC-three component system middle component 6 n=1 Tax=Actinomadura kijaniata TaxID=46161 RepID=UPI000831115A|nr:ABC-three component system middle component 6 [Actinomadura kijaniata]